MDPTRGMPGIPKEINIVCFAMVEYTYGIRREADMARTPIITKIGKIMLHILKPILHVCWNQLILESLLNGFPFSA